MTNCTIGASSTFGIVAESGTTLAASGNCFENNAEGGVRNDDNRGSGRSIDLQ